MGCIPSKPPQNAEAYADPRSKYLPSPIKKLASFKTEHSTTQASTKLETPLFTSKLTNLQFSALPNGVQRT